MSRVAENAFRMIGVLIEEGNGGLSGGEFRRRMDLPKEEFDQAHQFLLQAGYINGTTGGDDGGCWVEALGVRHYEQQMRQRLPVSQLAKRIGQFVRRHAEMKGAPVASEEICSQLGISREVYLDGIREIADFGLVEETLKIDQEPFKIVNLTAKGQRAIRSGLERELPSVAQEIGAVSEGPGSGGTMEAIAQVYESVVQESVERGDVEALIEALSDMTDEMVEAVRPELTTEQLAAYAAAARNLREQVEKEELNSSVIQRLIATLAFFDNLNGTLDLGKKPLRLALRVAPYVPVLLQAVDSLPGSMV